MNRSLLAALVFLSFAAAGQDTMYYDKRGRQIAGRSGAKYFGFVRHDDSRPDSAVAYLYYRSGQIAECAPYSRYSRRIPGGHYQAWHPTGILKADMFYSAGVPQGWLRTWWSSGHARRADYYENGRSVTGVCFSRHKFTVPHTDYATAPLFEGNLSQFLARYGAVPAGGSAYSTMVRLSVERDGNLSQVAVVESGSEEERRRAERMMEAMPRWKPGTRDGDPAQMAVLLLLRFEK